MGIREQYEASELDLERIRRYARKVAKEKGPFPGGEHVIESREWTRTDVSGPTTEEHEERIRYVLTNDGRLLRKSTYWTDVTISDGRRYAYREDNRGESVREFEQQDVELFDHENYYKLSNGRGSRVSGNREPGRRVLYHARGVGLSKRLKAILES